MRGAGVGEAVRVEEPRVVRAEHGHRAVGEREVGQRVVLQVGGALVGGTVGPQRLADRADAAPRTVLDELLQRGEQPRRVEAQAPHVLEDHGLRVVAQRVADEGQVGVGQRHDHRVVGLEAGTDVADHAGDELLVALVEEGRVLEATRRRGDVARGSSDTVTLTPPRSVAASIRMRRSWPLGARRRHPIPPSGPADATDGRVRWARWVTAATPSYTASAPRSPVRTRVTRSTGTTHRRPSGCTAPATSPSDPLDDLVVQDRLDPQAGRELVDDDLSPVRSTRRPSELGPRTSEMVIPSTAWRSRARRTSSSACGGTIACNIFTASAPLVLADATGPGAAGRGCAAYAAAMADRTAASPAPVVLVLGGRSEIGVALACRLAASGRAGTVVLAARRADDLAAETAAVRSAGAEVATVEFDADDLGAQAAVLDAVEARARGARHRGLAFGVLGDQARAERDAAHAAAVVHTDYTAQVAVLTEVAARLRARGPRRDRRVLVGGRRARAARQLRLRLGEGRASTASPPGLADALHGSGVHLTLVRPGFVIGRMTADSGLDPAPLSSTPGQVADATADALTTGATSSGCRARCACCSPPCACCPAGPGGACRGEVRSAAREQIWVAGATHISHVRVSAS